MFRSLSLRLTLQFSVIFALLTLTAFSLSYVNLQKILLKKIDKKLITDAFEIEKTLQTHGLEEAIREVNLEAEAEGINRVFIRFFSPQKKLLATSNLSAWPDIQIIPEKSNPTTSQMFNTLRIEGMQYQTRLLTQTFEGDYLLQIGFLLKEDSKLLEDFRKVFGIAFLSMIFCGYLSGLMISKRAMKGIEKVRQTADRMGQGDFSHRVALGNDGEEIISLALTFNQMQDRIARLIAELRDVTNNIAHDLRSPLTRIRGLAETTLTGPQKMTEYQDMAGLVIEECDKLTSMVNTMLEIAETDAGLQAPPEVSVDMAKIIKDVSQLFLTVADDKSLEIHLSGASKPLWVLGDRSRLQRTVANLVDNAIKYTPHGGKVEICATADNQWVLISISDTGPGIPEDKWEHIFARFFRLDESRSTPGCGLGLSLARSVAQAHGGEIKLDSDLGKGSTFTLRLPSEQLDL